MVQGLQVDSSNYELVRKEGHLSSTQAPLWLGNQCEKLFLQLAHDIKEHDIPVELHINTNQSQGVFAQGSSFIWTKTGSKQVSVVGAEEKHAHTIVVSVSSLGVLLPFQVVYEGKMSVPLPNKFSPYYTQAMEAGFWFEILGNKTYWSTQKTMWLLIDDIIAPYVLEQKQKLGLPEEQKSI